MGQRTDSLNAGADRLAIDQIPGACSALNATSTRATRRPTLEDITREDCDERRCIFYELRDIVDHVAGPGFLNSHAVDDQSLVKALHWIAIELFWHDPGAMWRERVVALADEPVRTGAVAARRTSATIGDIHRNHVTEHVVVRTSRGNVFARATEDDGHFDFPFDPITSEGHYDIVTVADDCSTGGLQEQVGNAAVYLTVASSRGQLIIVASLAGMCIEVHGSIHDFAWILNWSHDVD